MQIEDPQQCQQTQNTRSGLVGPKQINLFPGIFSISHRCSESWFWQLQPLTVFYKYSFLSTWTEVPSTSKYFPPHSKYPLNPQKTISHRTASKDKGLPLVRVNENKLVCLPPFWHKFHTCYATSTSLHLWYTHEGSNFFLLEFSQYRGYQVWPFFHTLPAYLVLYIYYYSIFLQIIMNEVYIYHLVIFEGPIQMQLYFIDSYNLKRYIFSMSKQKVKVQIEICSNCKSHQWCTRHNEANYSSLAMELEKTIKSHDDSIEVEIFQVSGAKMGSFEITCNGTLLFSKLQLGYFPHVPSATTRILSFVDDFRKGNDLHKYSEGKNVSPNKTINTGSGPFSPNSPKKEDGKRIKYNPDYHDPNKPQNEPTFVLNEKKDPPKQQQKAVEKKPEEKKPEEKRHEQKKAPQHKNHQAKQKKPEEKKGSEHKIDKHDQAKEKKHTESKHEVKHQEKHDDKKKQVTKEDHHKTDEHKKTDGDHKHETQKKQTQKKAEEAHKQKKDEPKHEIKHEQKKEEHKNTEQHKKEVKHTDHETKKHTEKAQKDHPKKDQPKKEQDNEATNFVQEAHFVLDENKGDKSVPHAEEKKKTTENQVAHKQLKQEHKAPEPKAQDKYEQEFEKQQEPKENEQVRLQGTS